MSDLKLYNPDAACAKCGSESITAVWYAKHSMRGRDCLNDELVLRTCKHCGYSWKERPLDAITPEEEMARLGDLRRRVGVTPCVLPSIQPLWEIREPRTGDPLPPEPQNTCGAPIAAGFAAVGRPDKSVMADDRPDYISAEEIGRRVDKSVDKFRDAILPKDGNV